MDGQTLREAEDDVLQHMGLLEETGGGKQYRALLRPRRWRRSRAIMVTQRLFWLAQYPVQVRTTLMHLTGQTPPLGVHLLQGFPLGIMFQRIRLWPQRLAGTATLAVRGHSGSLARSAAGLLVHYGMYAVSYGLVRQSLVAQIAGGSLRSLLAPSLEWIRHLFSLRSSGSVLSMYVCDTLQRMLLSVVKQAVSFALLSVCVVPKFKTFAERDSERLLTEMVLDMTQQDGVAEGADSGSTYDWRVIRRVEFLCFTEAVGSMLSGVVTRALMYPIDTVLVRLLADEAGLTSYGFSGFFACLKHTYRAGGLHALFYGFSTALSWDLALSWPFIELMHLLCKSAWIAF
ncbi:hypothetical protein EV183_000510 [Coemansia sp. RSA 2336]|nr:hypothetical protein EV183_000510 [Coemansia sp. RSA 2336]